MNREVLEVSKVLDMLYISGKAPTSNAMRLHGMGIRAVLDVCDVFDDDTEAMRRNFSFKHIPMVDVAEYDIGAHLDEALAFMRSNIEKGRPVLVHCVMGISRSATTVIAYLCEYEGMSLEEAYLLLKTKRSIIGPNIGFISALLRRYG